LWGAAHRCAQDNPASVAQAGFTGDGLEPGERLFDAILTNPSGLVFSVDEPEVGLSRLRTDDGKAHLAIPELLEELDGLATEAAPGGSTEFPFVLSAGERRSFTANTIFRDPGWRKRDAGGSLRVSPADAAELGLAEGDLVRVTTKRGSVLAPAEVNEVMQPGHVSLPNGLGVDYPSEDGAAVVTGAAPNELTASEDRDWIAGTPWHKHVPARLERVESALDAPAIASA
ncbi:MAG: molybdopterin dinucleotide binding domain-containing protein, partial [Acidimicrobiales bacterium]